MPNRKGNKHTPEARAKMSATRKGRVSNRKGIKMSEEQKIKIRDALKGRDNYWIRGTKQTLEQRRMRSERFKGSKNPNWKGGITREYLVIRASLEYRLWRTAVFERDLYTCIWCGDNRGGNLEADHIKPFAYFPELRFAIDNGRTLCHYCHITTETYGNKYRDELGKFTKNN